MTDIPQASVPPPAATSASVDQHAPVPLQVGWRQRSRAVLVAVLLALLTVALWWLNHSRIGLLEREFARRIQDGDVVVQESRVLSRQALDQVMALQTRLGVLESRVAESQSQQLALEQLYQELSRSRDEWALAEIEQILAVAGQQLQLAGNVQGALIALQNADNRLARTDKPQFIALRRVLARDIERLKALPGVDVAGSALRLDSLIGMVDTLPMLVDAKPAARPRLDAQPVERGERKTGVGGAASSSLEWLQDKARYALAQLWETFEDLVRVREIEAPEAMLLAPDQAFFVRENLKLRLLNARLALLARQEATYRADLLQAHETLQRYFDIRARQTVVALAVLKQVQASNTVVELPTLAESMNAVRNFKAPRER